MTTVKQTAQPQKTGQDAAGPGPGLVLALDIGSSRLKGGVVGMDGSLLYMRSTESPLRAAGSLETEPVWQAVRTLLLELAEQCKTAPIAAIAVTGATRSHVFLDSRQLPCAPLMLWHEPYGSAQGERIARAYGLPGDAPGYGAFHPLARALQWQVDGGAAPSRLAELKDWINFRLTGRLVTDAVAYGRVEPSQASGLRLENVLSRLGLPAALIPPRALPVSIVGHVDAKSLQGGADGAMTAALAGVPVVVGSFDTWASCLGMGAMIDEGVYDISGTTQVLGTFSRMPRPLRGMISMRWTPELWQTGGPCQTGMGTLAWFARSFLDSNDPADTLAAAQLSHHADLPLCLPYLSGERMPLWSDTLSASFHGVKSHHSRADMAKSLVEGLVLAHRLALDSLQVRKPQSLLRMGGGGAGLASWVQGRADAFGMTIVLGGTPESALVGAGLAAACAIGAWPDLAAAQASLAASRTLVQPDTVRTAYFDGRAMEFSSMLSRDPSLS